MRQHAKYDSTEFPPVLARFLRRLGNDAASGAGKAGGGAGSASTGEGGSSGDENAAAAAPPQSLFERTVEAFKKSQVRGGRVWGEGRGGEGRRSPGLAALVTTTK